jgi:hypothetical protein
VATSHSRAYFALVSRLRQTQFPFQSLVPGMGFSGCDIVLTTKEEASRYGSRAMEFESLDENPFVMKGQILSRMTGGSEILFFGVDPGTRIGMAAFYGESSLEFATFESVEDLCARVSSFVRNVPAKRSLIRIGNGNPALTTRLASALSEKVPAATLEIVNEEGTSTRIAGMKGLQGDQRAAAKIAFRKGVPFLPPGPRTRE